MSVHTCRRVYGPVKSGPRPMEVLATEDMRHLKQHHKHDHSSLCSLIHSKDKHHKPQITSQTTDLSLIILHYVEKENKSSTPR
jgi:hypothetical protein